MFAKIFASIFDSSIADDWQLRLVFQDMLVLADKDGIVDMTPQAISRRTNVPLEIVLDRIRLLEGDDPMSRTPTENGRRLTRIDPHREWGWQIVNYVKYRESANKDMLRMADADRKRAYRERFKKGSPTPPSKNCTERQEEEAEQSRTSVRHVPDIPPPGVSVKKELNGTAEEIYRLYPRKVARPAAIRAITKAIQKHGSETLLAATSNFSKAWTGAGEDIQFCPHPATWFNQERYNDDPTTWRNQNGVARTPFNLKALIEAKQESADKIAKKHQSVDRWDSKENYESYIAIIKEIRVLKDELSRLT